MTRNIKTLACLFALCPVVAFAQDSIRTINLQTVEIVSSIKEHGYLRQQPSAVSILGSEQLNANHVTSLKGISSVVPNLFIPDYGSRLTSAVYIRGIGSRMNTPAVGLYIDNMPYADKSAFEFNLTDIERIDVMRGPQGTLYGRNTMGGIVKVYTRNPFFYQGTNLNMGFTTRDNRYRIALTHYHRPSDKFAFSAGGYYEGSRGMFTNDITGKRIDGVSAVGGKLRAIWLPTSRLNLDFNASYDYSDEGAYPYFYTGTLTDKEEYADYIGKITNNHENRYRRGIFNAGVNLGYSFSGVKMNSVTSFQNIGDRMFLDQDFMQPDIYTLEQKQRINTLNEELTFRSDNDSPWQWVSGLSIMQQWLHTTGPVTFYSDGLDWLANNINSNMPKFPVMGVSFTDESLEMGGTFDTPTFNAAIFHQSTYKFSDHFSATLGLRLDYERNSIDYDAPADMSYDYSLSMGKMAVSIPDISCVINEYQGSMHNDYLKVLPKLSLKYDINGSNNIYFTISKGMRSGGYNVQMFSDILQGAMKAKMVDGVKEAVFKYLEQNMPALADNLKPTIESVMPKFDMPDVSQVSYKPEYSWNYELGTHLTPCNRLSLDAALYYIHTRDQQIARFTDSGLGRMMVNAGQSESLGGEFSVSWIPVKNLTLTGNYGFTHAKFTDYDAGNSLDYTGCYVPFVPQHTVNIDAAYTIHTGTEADFLQTITLGATYSGAGRIYWTESNNASQNYYQQLNARISLGTKYFTLDIWGRNITDTKYNTFYFESASRGYEQHGKPFQIGFDLRCKF